MNELSRRIGKFDSPESLLKAYQSLESEFTKRSQRLKEVEKENQKLTQDLLDAEKLNKYAVDALNDEEFVQNNVINRQEIKECIISQYLKALSSGNNTNLLGSKLGKSALTPPAKPSTLSEAKRLADILLN